MANGIRTGDPDGFNKGRCSKFHQGSQVWQTSEEGRRTYRPKRCGNNNKCEDNSPKTLNDKNYQASSQKYRQIRINKQWLLLILNGNFILEGIFDVLPDLLLFIVVFFCIFPIRLMRACDFCLSCSGFMGHKFFSLTLMLFGGRIGNSCNGCFVGDFALLGVVRVGLVDRTCVFVGTTTLDLSPFPTRCWAGAWQNSAEWSFFRCSWNFVLFWGASGSESFPSIRVCLLLAIYAVAESNYRRCGFFKSCMAWRITNLSWRFSNLVFLCGS